MISNGSRYIHAGATFTSPLGRPTLFTLINPCSPLSR